MCIRDSSETEEVLFEILEPDQEIIVLEGGKGGLGNWNFKSSTNQTPRYAQSGIPGQELKITLELKVLADVGLVGFPNAGKSSLLACLTAAKPKIADYEFTTLKPNLGIVPYRDFQSFVMADIPGSITGASEGKGLGHYFLRHIERNSVLLFLIPADTDDIKKVFDILMTCINIENGGSSTSNRKVSNSNGSHQIILGGQYPQIEQLIPHGHDQTIKNP